MAPGHWGQARVTGHEATHGTEQDRQIGTFALSRARKLAKRPESAPTLATTAEWYRYPERGQRVSGLTTRPGQHLMDDPDTSCRQVEIAAPIGPTTRPREAE
jgi:hypothetical protein